MFLLFYEDNEFNGNKNQPNKYGRCGGGQEHMFLSAVNELVAYGYGEKM